MKKIKLLLAAVAAMVTMGVNAQSWTAPTIQGEDPVAGQQYKVMNVGAGTFLDMGKAWFSWNTTAILSNTGVNFTMTADGDNWKFIRTGTQGVFTSGNGIAGDAMHVDNTAHTYGITKLPNGYYHIHDTGGDASSLCWGNDGTTVGVVAHADATAEGWNCEWVFIQPANVATVANLYSARLALYSKLVEADEAGIDTEAAGEIYTTSEDPDAVNAAATELTRAINKARFATLFAGASDENPIDVTAYCLTNPAFENGTIGGWETNYVSGVQANNIGYQGASYTNGDVTINHFIEAWRWSPALGDGYLRQTVLGLPEGKYLLECDAIAADQPGKTMPTGAYLYINAAGVDYKTTMATEDGKPQHFSCQFLSPGDVDVTFGMKTESTTANWIGADNFTVKFYGIDLSPYATLLAEAVAAAEAVEEGSIPAAAYSALTAVVTENNQTWTSSAEYTTAIAAIQAATTNATALASAYATYKAERASILAINNSIDLSDAEAAAAAAATADEMSSATAMLIPSFKSYLATVEDEEIDLTSVLITNPGFETGNINGWTSDGTQTPGAQGNKAFDNVQDDFYCERWHADGTVNIYQTLTDMPAGYYELTAYAYTGASAGQLYANSNSVDFTTSALYTLPFKTEEAGDIKIGLTGEVTGSSWLCMDAFTLKFLGTNPVTLFQTKYNAALAAAQAAKENAAYVNVTGSELTALNAAIAAEPESTIASYLEKTEALTTATSTFTAAAPSYNKYVAYRAETVGAWGEELASTVDAPTTAAEAITAVQALNIAQYNKVASDYTYSATGLIGDFGSWTGTATVAGVEAKPNYLDYEHWSGNIHAYYEQASTGWGNANGWTIKYEKTCTLPAGDYVIKVAARSSAGTTSLVSCSATDVTVTLPNLGAATRGINTDGEASWSDDDTFAIGNNNNTTPAVGGQGLGWQWRFLPFTLAEETEVTMTFYAEATTQYQWMSIADGELLSTDKLAEDVAYNEDDDNTIENKIIADVTMTRNIKAGYNSVVLPFTLTANQVAAAFGANSEVYNFSENSDDANQVTVNFNKGDGSISANTPVLVKATAASTEQVFNGVQIEAPTTDVKVAGTNVDFMGVYGPTTVIAGDYFMNSGKLYKSNGNTNIKAFRAYIDATEESSVKFFIGGQAFDYETAVNGIEAAPAENGAIYNIAGQRVSKAQKGIFIVNGKKIVK